ncbi:ATP-binding cassette domain-containing protein [Streptomyces avidinii]|uniref:ATP-binding cassette domain-containing protein n=1 Tax=Streptomyces TaxID=1883 RepID=UPI0038646BB2
MRAEGLTRQHRGKRIVDDVHLNVPAGVVTGFLGANGAGKTTTLPLMLGLISGQGTTTYFGRSLAQWRESARTVGVVMGGVAGHPRQTLTAPLRMVAAGAGVRDSRMPEVIDSRVDSGTDAVWSGAIAAGRFHRAAVRGSGRPGVAGVRGGDEFRDDVRVGGPL